MNDSKRLSLTMTKKEVLWGWLYFLLYLLALPSLLQVLFDFFRWDYSTSAGMARLNFVYFVLNFVAILVIFHKFLWKSLGAVGRRFWGFIQAIILGYVMYQAATYLVSLLIFRLRPGLQNLNNQFFASQAAGGFLLTAIGTALLAPPVEECFFRGLLFEELHRVNRILAYVLSTLAFALVHVLPYLPQYGLGASLLIFLQYLPAGIALGWAYEKADTIFAPVAIHMIINAVTIGLMRL